MTLVLMRAVGLLNLTQQAGHVPRVSGIPSHEKNINQPTWTIYSVYPPCLSNRRKQSLCPTLLDRGREPELFKESRTDGTLFFLK